MFLSCIDSRFVEPVRAFTAKNGLRGIVPVRNRWRRREAGALMAVGGTLEPVG
jgi:hypothetical protein